MPGPLLADGAVVPPLPSCRHPGR